MLFKRIYDEDLAQASYFIGCQASGTAIVVDPRRDIQVYLDEAKRNAMTIAAVTETHIHADYLSGARELAAATGATLYLSDEGGDDWQYRFEHEGLRDKSDIKVGNITLKAVHTPGHTPEHLSFLVTDGAASDKPGYILTGDFVFVGDIGRPDLLDEAAGGENTRLPMAKTLFRSLKEKFLTLPEYVQVWPGHGAGSACGKALGAVASSTVGYEKLTAWWVPYLLRDDEEGFVAALLEGQPDAPLYFGRMKRQNRAGPALLGQRPPLTRLEGEALQKRLAEGATLIDTRPRQVYAVDAVPGSLHVPAGTSFVTWASWIINPERQRGELVLLAESEAQANALRDQLARVGIDNVTSYATTLAGLATEPVDRVAPKELEQLKGAFILDVRTKNEYDAGHIASATQLHGGRIVWHLDKLPKDRPIITYCQSGARSAVVASALRAAGFGDIRELEGGYEAWKRAQGAGIYA
jgi:hydroxyacylglutathione hydrolase